MARQRGPLRRAVSTAAKDVLYWNVYPFEYRRFIQTPVNPLKAVFLEGRKDALPDDFRLLWDALEERGYDVRFVTLARHSSSFPGYVQNCRNAVRELADARFVFLNDASDLVSCLPLRPATTVVQLWHACGAFKKWGMSTADLLFGGSRFEKERHPFYENLGLVTVSAPEVAWAYREAMALGKTPEVVQPLGVSRTDVYFDPDFLAHARGQVDAAIPGIAGRRVLLYAPTFRGTTGHAEGPGWLDVRAMKRRLGDEWALLVKHHPYVKTPPAFPDDCREFAFDAGECRIDELMARADACVTDYSSIVFEYSLLGRPMAFFAPDIADYDDWRGFYYDYDELTPGPVFTETDPLADWVADVDARFDAVQMTAFREKFMAACDGRATARLLAWLGIG